MLITHWNTIQNQRATKTQKNSSFDAEFNENQTISLSNKNNTINWKTKVVSMDSVAKISGSTGTMTSDNVLPTSGHYLVTTGNYYDYNQKTYYSCMIDVNYKYVDSISYKGRIGFKNVLESTSMLYYIKQRAGSNPLKIIANKYSFF